MASEATIYGDAISLLPQNGGVIGVSFTIKSFVQSIEVFINLYIIVIALKNCTEKIDKLRFMIALPWPKERKTLKLQKILLQKLLKLKLYKAIKIRSRHRQSLFVISQLPRQISVMYDQYMNVSLK